MEKAPTWASLIDWLDSIQKTQRWLWGELKDLGARDPQTINSWATWRINIPAKFHEKLKELGYSGPFKRPELRHKESGPDIQGEMAGHVDNLKGYMDAKFRDAHDEREALAEILRAMFVQLNDIGVKLGLPSLGSSPAKRL